MINMKNSFKILCVFLASVVGILCNLIFDQLSKLPTYYNYNNGSYLQILNKYYITMGISSAFAACCTAFFLKIRLRITILIIIFAAIIFTAIIHSSEPDFPTIIFPTIFETLLLYLPSALTIVTINFLVIFWYKKVQQTKLPNKSFNGTANQQRCLASLRWRFGAR